MSLSVSTMQRKSRSLMAMLAGLSVVLLGFALAGAQTLPDVVATIDDQSITAEELTASIRGELLKIDSGH